MLFRCRNLLRRRNFLWFSFHKHFVSFFFVCFLCFGDARRCRCRLCPHSTGVYVLLLLRKWHSGGGCRHPLHCCVLGHSSVLPSTIHITVVATIAWLRVGCCCCCSSPLSHPATVFGGTGCWCVLVTTVDCEQISLFLSLEKRRRNRIFLYLVVGVSHSYTGLPYTGVSVVCVCFRCCCVSNESKCNG